MKKTLLASLAQPRVVTAIAAAVVALAGAFGLVIRPELAAPLIDAATAIVVALGG